MDKSLEILNRLTAAYGPPGDERSVRGVMSAVCSEFGIATCVDAAGNLLIGAETPPETTRVLVTAHLDEIALMVTRVEEDGLLQVAPLGGVHPYKWGERMVVLLGKTHVNGVLGFGGIHTEAEGSNAQLGRTGRMTWDRARIFTGLSAGRLQELGVHVGTRAALHTSCRGVQPLGEYWSSPFLDDRADLLAMLLAADCLKSYPPCEVLFAATVSEEVGGEGAKWLCRSCRPHLCIALEIGPDVEDAPVSLEPTPSVWTHDGYSSPRAEDLELVSDVCASLGYAPQWQALSRGGSDASMAASLGLVPRHLTLGLPVRNSHGQEVMHRQAPQALAELLCALLRALH
jgi:putative aminopeptidase FrvX